MAQITNWQSQSDSHLPGHDDETHVPSKHGHHEQQSASRLIAKQTVSLFLSCLKSPTWDISHLLQPSSSLIVPPRSLPVCPRQNPRARGNEQENGGKHGVNLAGEDEKSKQGEPPNEQVKSHDRVVFPRRKPRGVGRSRVRGAELDGRELEHAKRQPKH